MKPRLVPSAPLPVVLPPKGVLDLKAGQVDQALAYLDTHYVRIYDGRSYLLVKGENIALERLEWRTSTIGAFREGFRGYDIPTTGGSTVPLAEVWLRRAPIHRELTFDPRGGVPSYVFNLWQGWTLTPDATADCTQLIEHVYEIVCAGNATLFDWLMHWCARLIQQPWAPAGTAVVLRGKQGVGKGPLWAALQAICGNHAIHVAHAGALSSRFNGMLAGCVFLHADEVVWGGDIIGANYLKALLTEPTIGIERKGHEVIHVKNCLHIAMNSNEQHVARVEGGDRRYAVFDVKDTYAGQNTSYFQPLWASIQNGAPSALMARLLETDLADFDPYRPPLTAAKVEMQLRGLSAAELWLLESAKKGTLAGVEFGQAVKVEDVYADYVKAMERRAMTRRSGETELGMLLAKALPAMRKRQRRLPGSSERPYWYFTPSLEAARETIAQAIDVAIEWPIEETEDE